MAATDVNGLEIEGAEDRPRSRGTWFSRSANPQAALRRGLPCCGPRRRSGIRCVLCTAPRAPAPDLSGESGHTAGGCHQQEDEPKHHSHSCVARRAPQPHQITGCPSPLRPGGVPGAAAAAHLPGLGLLFVGVAGFVPSVLVSVRRFGAPGLPVRGRSTDDELVGFAELVLAAGFERFSSM